MVRPRKKLTPVRRGAGRRRRQDPSCMGRATTKTDRIVVVAALAANPRKGDAVADPTATRRPPNRGQFRQIDAIRLPSGIRTSASRLRIPVHLSPWRNSRRRSAFVSEDAPLSNPMTRHRRRLLHPPRGHVAAAPTSAAARLFTRSPRRRGPKSGSGKGSLVLWRF